MNEPLKERRRISYVSLVESAMRSANQLFASKDAAARSAASRVLSDLQKLRTEMPARRRDDDGKINVLGTIKLPRVGIIILPIKLDLKAHLEIYTTNMEAYFCRF